ncbi:hypothetical protein LJR231_002837 [Phyllobacterium sp. LjRoot231]|uniref:hypothetical protein n=1 Tax=Phyllobacterium sp. LjRoot231 TaxID=3342289 RepID=UPI003ED104AC
MKSLIIAAMVGLSGLPVSGCVETTGPYYGGYSGYGGYYGTTIYDGGFYDGPSYYRPRYYRPRYYRPGYDYRYRPGYDYRHDDWRNNSRRREDWRRNNDQVRVDRPNTPRPPRNDDRPSTGGPGNAPIYIPPVSRPGGYNGNQQR